MNRTIKFRVWDKKEKVIGRVADLNTMEGIERLFRTTVGTEFLKARPIDQLQLMQFTGLHDKNGKEIYEGDIVSNGGVNAEIIYTLGSTGFELRETKKGLFVGSPSNWKNIVVVGNVYENPELLNQHNSMDTIIIKKAIEGGWQPLKTYIVRDTDAVEQIDFQTIAFYNGTDVELGAPIGRINIYRMFCDPLFWQALGKALGWVEGTYENTWEEIYDTFFTLNRRFDWDKAVEYLESVTK